MAEREPGRGEGLDLALRAWAVPETRLERRGRPTRSEHPGWWLVFDTETKLDPAQSLTFGVARAYRPRHRNSQDEPLGRECFGEFWFYGESLAAGEVAVLEGLAADRPTREYHGRFWDPRAQTFKQTRSVVHLTDDGVPLVVLPREKFVHDVFVPMARRGRFLVVGFALPFDLSRLAVSWSGTRRPRRGRVDGRLPPREVPWDAFTGGFSLKLTSSRGEAHLPRIAIKTIDSKRHLMALRGEDEDGREPSPATPRPARFRGHFLDLRTLAFVLTNTGNSLDGACKAFETAHQKLDHRPTGRVSAEEVEYGRGDVLATYDLAEALVAEYARHPVSPDHDTKARAAAPLQATKAYSPASLGKAYLEAMGVTPPLERGWSIDPAFLAHAMTAFYGGRAECRLRRTAMPVTYVDFTSMYTTVNGLLDLWRLLTAAHVAVTPATEDVRALLAGVSLEGVFDSSLWPSLVGFARVRPSGDVLPSRAAYDGPAGGWQIGVNPVESEAALWYALPDLVASALLTGRPPEVVEAVRLVPTGVLSELRPVALRGEVTVDPGTSDFFAAVVERRAAVPDRDGAGKPLSDFLKVLANATSYGIFAEMVRHALPGDERMPVTVRGLGPPRTVQVTSPEEPGRYAFPPLAAIITAAARLMLALLERSVTDAGGSYVMVDTDSMAIVSDEAGSLLPCPGGQHISPGGAEAVQALSWDDVDAIRRRFAGLNPYAAGRIADILKLEDHNFTPAPTADRPDAVDRSRRLQLHAYAISAKRYALFNEVAGDVAVRKPSEHGLGHLMNPDDPDDRTGRQWIGHLWRSIILEGRGRPADSLPFAHRPAVSRLTASAPGLLRPFAAYNAGRPPTAQVRPFNFLLSGTVARLGHPPDTDPAHFHLLARYERDPAKWLRMRWVDRYTGRTYAVTTGPAAGESVRLKSVADLAAEYATHPERKSLGPDGRPADRGTVGLLRRRPIAVRGVTLIGKEANELEAMSAEQVQDLEEVLTDYGPEEDRWATELLPALAMMPTADIARRAGVSQRTVQRAVAGRATPHPKAAARIRAAAEDYARKWLRAAGRDAPKRGREALDLFRLARVAKHRSAVAPRLRTSTSPRAEPGDN